MAGVGSEAHRVRVCEVSCDATKENEMMTLWINSE